MFSKKLAWLDFYFFYLQSPTLPSACTYLWKVWVGDVHTSWTWRGWRWVKINQLDVFVKCEMSNVKCEKCTFTSRSSQVFISHKKTHSNLQFTCLKCKKTFSKTANLSRHSKICPLKWIHDITTQINLNLNRWCMLFRVLQWRYCRILETGKKSFSKHYTLDGCGCRKSLDETCYTSACHD